MAATAYATLVSLLNTVDLIHNHRLVSTFFDTNQNKSLSEKINFFVDFVEKYSDADSKEVEDLVCQIAVAAHKAENIIEVHAADRVRGAKNPSFLPNLQMIIEKMESIEEEVIKVKEEIGKSPSFSTNLPPSSTSSSSLGPPATGEATTMVGFDEYALKLWDDLVGPEKCRQIISITGMGGIGKTTLARNLYEKSNTSGCFNARAWITVSQESSARKVYLQALSCLGIDSSNRATANDQQLSRELHKALFNCRYLIVLDDVWSGDLLDKIKLFCPENNNGSRIVVTTRQTELVHNDGSSTAIALDILGEENSWKLFCDKTFPQKDFPPELEEVGRKIVKKCGGLPLAINVVGGLLRKSPTKEYWEKIASDKSLILDLGEDTPSSILYMSYKYLPVCLKSCFLHFGLYPEDFEVEVSQVIKLWIGEGFIKPNRGQSLEEVATNYFNDLVVRNLLLLRSSTTPRSKHCSIHDLLRDLCMTIGEKENFFYVQKSIVGNRHFLTNKNMVKFYPKEPHSLEESHSSETPSILRPLIVPGKRAAPLKSRLLRVLCCDKGNRYYPFQEVNMRYLRDHSYIKEHDYFLPSLVSRFWSLQTLIVIVSEKVGAPPDIWKMSQLRHIDVTLISLPDPPPASDDDVCVLQNLQTLRRVQNLVFTEEVCNRIPDVKELEIDCDFSLQSPCYHLENIGRFDKLELLKYSCFISEHPAGDSLQTIKFPSSLKELTLSRCMLEWSYMAAIASLPLLEFLEIYGSAFAATEWGFEDEQFKSLKHLHIIHCNSVTEWTADHSNFPVLETLTMSHFWQLDEIPPGVGEIPTLQVIHLEDCSQSANVSAVEILYEKERFDNLDLQVAIKCDEPKLLRKEIEEREITCQNLVIKCEYYLISPS